MDPIIKTYIEFYCYDCERDLWVKTITEATSRKPAGIEAPDNVCFFKFYDVVVATMEVDGIAHELHSKRFNFSGNYYYGGHIYTIDEIVAEVRDSEDLVSSIKKANTDRAIFLFASNSWMEFYQGKDVLLPIKESAVAQ
ncbi:MAG: hypothetical protein WCO23_02920 [bacterium]